MSFLLEEPNNIMDFFFPPSKRGREIIAIIAVTGQHKTKLEIFFLDKKTPAFQAEEAP